MLEHASYKMTKQRKYLQTVIKHGPLTTEGHLIFYIKKKVGKNLKQPSKPPTVGSSHTKFFTSLVISILPLICRLVSSPQEAKPLTILGLFKCFSLILKVILNCFTYKKTKLLMHPFRTEKCAYVKSVQVVFLLPL